MTAALRTSGLRKVLPPEKLRALFLLLAFLLPNGRIQPTLPYLAEAVQALYAQAHARMPHLSRRERH